MNISTLNKYNLIPGEIRNLEEKIMKIEAKLCTSPAFDFSGVPKNPTPRNRTEETYIDMFTRKEELKEKVKEYEDLKASIEKYIDGIEDMLVHRIAEERVFKNKMFREIAEELGGKNTKDSVKKIYYRYVANNP